jgi:subtilisin family serine protease
VLVGYRPGTPLTDRSAARQSVHAAAARKLSPLARDAERLDLPRGLSVDAAISALRHNPNVRYAEPDYVLSTDAVPNDPGVTGGYLWGMLSGTSSPSNAYGTGAIDAWASGYTGNRNVVVGVVDEGIQIDHPDLAANIWTNPGEIAGNGVDDDGNGYVDDIHGWDFLHDDNSVYDGPTKDGHGTHVAGTIGAAGGNGQGVAGVNWAVSIVSAKFLEDTGDTADAIQALDYLTDLKLNHDVDVVATNNSWGGGEFSQALVDAINRGGDAGILFVAAAGNSHANDDNPATAFYPAASACTTRFDTGAPRGWDCIVSVAAIDDAGARATFSNYGSTTVDLGAPGVDIVSTYPSDVYASADGTSMAAPHVTGAVALLASCNGPLGPSQIRSDLLGTGAATPSLAGKTVTGKRLDVAALTAADCDASAPTTTTTAILTRPASPTHAATLSWGLAFSESVTGLTASDLLRTGSAAGCVVGSPVPLGAATYTVPVTGCGSGTVSLSLKAQSVLDGASNLSPAAAVDGGTVIVDRHAPTTTAPVAAARLKAALSGSKVPLRISWTGSDVGTGIVRYELWRSTNGGTWTIVSSALTTPSATVAAASGSTVRFRVRAIDAAGNVGAWATGPTIAVSLLQQTSSAIHYRGSWATGRSTSYSGGSVRYATAAGASATFTFTGRGIALVSTLASTRGKVRIYIDGTYVAKVDLGASPTMYRAIVWQRTWSSSRSRTIKLVVDGTSTRPRIDLDAFAILR